MRKLEVGEQTETSFKDFVSKQLSHYTNDTYLVVFANGHLAALPFHRWRIRVLEQHEAVCSRDTELSFKYGGIGWLWLNRFNRIH
jgi:hypothetical protein